MTGLVLARLAAASLLLVAALVGCGSAESGGGEPVATSQVDLPRSYRFSPEDISVATGTTVTWTNSDVFTHSVQFLNGGLPAEPLVMAPGETTTFTFETAGVFDYQCHLHPRDMTGSVTVTD
jgi:plastocyanin